MPRNYQKISVLARKNIFKIWIEAHKNPLPHELTRISLKKFRFKRNINSY
jgi:hypothetical protein